MTIMEIIWLVIKLILSGVSREEAIAEISARYGVDPGEIRRHLK